MESNRKVYELRERSLSTTKATLVNRLDSKESVPMGDSNKGSKKRGRGNIAEDGDYNGCPLKIRAIDDFKNLTINELRKEASLRGIPSGGVKEEIIERLCKDSETSKMDMKENKKGVHTMKGPAVLDKFLSDEIKSQYHVLQRGNVVYHATLNQTNVGRNNNKFYVIQALEFNDGDKFMVYNRWGRVGIKGQDKLRGPYTCIQCAKNEFRKKFHDKTKNYWCERKEFVSQPKLYTWFEIDYEAWKKAVVMNLERQRRETKLEERIADFIYLICNKSMMVEQMTEIGYNAKEFPLGGLSKATISKGYEVLKKIADVIDENNKEKLEKLSGDFYSIIPHVVGLREMRKFVIDTPEMLKLKLEMVESLGEIEVATKLLKNVEMEEDPFVSCYKRLHCELTPVEVDSEDFLMIKKYMKNTHGKTHSNLTAEIVQIFKASRDGEADNFSKFSNTDNRMLLWHGSLLSNWVSILSQGLRIAPPNAPATGYMFGKGVYFADMFSKSARYSRGNKQAPDGVLLLCEVALGEMVELLRGDEHADMLPQGKLSTKGVGVTGPDMSESEPLEDGVVVPLGHPIRQLPKKFDLDYNEYVVYDVNQIKMHYVVHVKSNYKN